MRSALLAAILTLAACSGGDTARPAPELRPVVDEAIAALEPLVPVLTEPEPADPAAVEGLVSLVANASGSMRDAGLVDLAGLGPGALTMLEQIASSLERTEVERDAALEGLFALGASEGPPVDVEAPFASQPADPLPLRHAAAEAIETCMVGERVPWLRARAAWHLGRLGLDRSIPQLVLRLKYETDPDAVVWIAWALGRFANYSGMIGLENVASGDAADAIRASARATADAQAAAAGIASAGELAWAWEHGDPERVLPHPERSAAHDLVLWRWIFRLNEFQLRGVDDTRFVFERLDEHAARILAAALSDESRYVRLHVSQCLARLGRRAGVAAAELIRALDDQEVATHAAEALGEIGHPPAREVLEPLLADSHPLELRVAAARALGRLGLAESAPVLAVHAEDPSAELRQALGESLAYVRSRSAALPLLAEALSNPLLEHTSTDAAIGFLLEHDAASGAEGARGRLAAWERLSDADPAERGAWLEREVVGSPDA